MTGPVHPETDHLDSGEIRSGEVLVEHRGEALNPAQVSPSSEGTSVPLVSAASELKLDPALRLLPDHAELIRASGISAEVAQARGYRSVIAVDELLRLGFGKYQAQIPVLLIPIRNVAGEIALHQIRPDKPRLKGDKLIKYETPRGGGLVLDVPPTVREQLADPAVDLFITEGSRKADAAVSKGLCCIALMGVWGWRGKNKAGGKTVLADWDYVALERRKVFIVFDSDVMTKPEVGTALRRLIGFLRTRRAIARVILLPAGDDGQKVGLDDYFAKGHGVEDLLSLVLENGADPAETGDLATLLSSGHSQADKLVQIALQTDIKLFHDDRSEAWARVPIQEHLESLSCSGRDFKRWLAGQYWRECSKAPSSNSLGAALNVIEAQARFEGPEHALNNR